LSSNNVSFQEERRRTPPTELLVRPFPATQCSKYVFAIAGVWGLITIIPLYFMFDVVGSQDPPPITHPQFYFGFLGVTLAWQIVFLVIARDPIRLRPIMIPSMVEKLTYVVAVVVLHLRGRMVLSQTLFILPDSILAVLFLVSFAQTRPGRPPV
jgi:hypothetical protein